MNWLGVIGKASKKTLLYTVRQPDKLEGELAPSSAPVPELGALWPMPLQNAQVIPLQRLCSESVHGLFNGLRGNSCCA